jgi:glyoxylase-like metal-dependent hydrolase (beta-lactamase superfamily II)
MQYEQVRPGLHRLDLPWKMGPTICPVATFLVQQEQGGWILVDAGYDSHATELVQAVKQQLGDQMLHKVLLTHAHLDHVAALPLLLDAYPNLKVCMHANEAPFLTEGISYSTIKGDNLVFNLAKHFLIDTKVRVPRERVELIKEGDVLGNVVQAVETHGHTPGSMSYLHIQSKSLLIGDAVMNFSAFSKCPSCSIFISTSMKQNAIDSLKKIVAMDIDTFYPAHDQSIGVSKKEISDLLK